MRRNGEAKARNPIKRGTGDCSIFTKSRGLLIKSLNLCSWCNVYLLFSFFFVTVIGVLPICAEEQDPIVAKVNGHEIRLSYVYQKIESLSLGDQIGVRKQLDRFIESTIQEEILFQFMIATDFQGEAAFRELVKASVAEYLLQKYIKGQIHVSEEAILKYYQEHESEIRGEHVRVRQILLKTKEECEQMKQKIDSEKTFAQMAKEHSLDKESASDGGMLGYFMRQSGSFGFEEQWFHLKLGEMGIYESPAGCHLVRKVGYVSGSTPPLERVRERIDTVLAGNQEISLLRSFLKKISQKIKVERMDINPSK